MRYSTKLGIEAKVQVELFVAEVITETKLPFRDGVPEILHILGEQRKTCFGVVYYLSVGRALVTSSVEVAHAAAYHRNKLSAANRACFQHNSTVSKFLDGVLVGGGHEINIPLEIFALYRIAVEGQFQAFVVHLTSVDHGILVTGGAVNCAAQDLVAGDTGIDGDVKPETAVEHLHIGTGFIGDGAEGFQVRVGQCRRILQATIIQIGRAHV